MGCDAVIQRWDFDRRFNDSEETEARRGGAHTHMESDKRYLLMFHIIVLISVSIVVNKVL